MAGKNIVVPSLHPLDIITKFSFLCCQVRRNSEPHFALSHGRTKSYPEYFWKWKNNLNGSVYRILYTYDLNNVFYILILFFRGQEWCTDSGCLDPVSTDPGKVEKIASSSEIWLKSGSIERKNYSNLSSHHSISAFRPLAIPFRNICSMWLDVR